jgi:glucose-1-phosphate adenylyltransferase
VTAAARQNLSPTFGLSEVVMHNVLSIILGGGRGTRLYPLTGHRSKPAVPVAGKYRLIDIPISNCINSDLNRIFVLTQFMTVSLHRHIANTYKFDPFCGGFVEILAAQQTNEAADWYQGTADAVRQQMNTITDQMCDDILILSGDQLYRMDFRQLLQTHHESKADATLAVIPVHRDQVEAFGLVRLNESGRIDAFIEKPRDDEALAPFHTPAELMARHGVPVRDRPYLASMGIYCFRREALLDLLNAKPLATDFGKEVFPRSLCSHKLQAHLFDGYWEDLGTVQAYHQASLALASDKPPFDFNSPAGVIFTRMRFLPASRVSGATLRRALISDGCLIKAGALVERSVIGVRSQIGRNAMIRDSVLIGADRYETDAEREQNRVRGLPDIGIGDDAVIERAIIDKDCRIGHKVRLVNARGIANEEGLNHVIRDGIIAIPRGTVLSDGMVI